MSVHRECPSPLAPESISFPIFSSILPPDARHLSTCCAFVRCPELQSRRCTVTGEERSRLDSGKNKQGTNKARKARSHLPRHSGLNPQTPRRRHAINKHERAKIFLCKKASSTGRTQQRAENQFQHKMHKPHAKQQGHNKTTETTMKPERPTRAKYENMGSTNATRIIQTPAVSSNDTTCKYVCMYIKDAGRRQTRPPEGAQ